MQDLTIFKEIIISMLKSLGGSVTKEYVLEPWFYRIINKLGLDYGRDVFASTINELRDEERICTFADMITVVNGESFAENSFEVDILKKVFPNYPNVGCTLKDVNFDFMLTFEDYVETVGLCNLYAIALVMMQSYTFKEKIRTVDLRNVASDFGSLSYKYNHNFFIQSDAICDYDSIASLYVLYSSGTLKITEDDVVFDFSNVSVEHFAMYNTAYYIANLNLYDEFKEIFVASAKERIENLATRYQPNIEKGTYSHYGDDKKNSSVFSLLAVIKTFGDNRVSSDIVESFLMSITDFAFDNCELFKTSTARLMAKRAKRTVVNFDGICIFAKLLSENIVKQ